MAYILTVLGVTRSAYVTQCVNDLRPWFTAGDREHPHARRPAVHRLSRPSKAPAPFENTNTRVYLVSSNFDALFSVRCGGRAVTQRTRRKKMLASRIMLLEFVAAMVRWA